MARLRHKRRFTNAALPKDIGLSEPTIRRIANGAHGIAPESKAGQLVLLLIGLFRDLDLLVGSDALWPISKVSLKGLVLAMNRLRRSALDLLCSLVGAGCRLHH